MPFETNGTWTDYPLPNATDLLGLAQYNNSITNDMFGLSLMLLIFIILYGSMSYTRSPVSLQVSLFITAIIGFLMLIINLVGMWVPMVFLVGFVASMIFLYKGGESSGV